MIPFVDGYFIHSNRIHSITPTASDSGYCKHHARHDVDLKKVALSHFCPVSRNDTSDDLPSDHFFFRILLLIFPRIPIIIIYDVNESYFRS